MTGTADTEAVEFDKIYSLEVVVIPPNRPMVRKDNQDVVYRTEEEKWHGVVEEIADCQKRRQPALVGTISIEKSETLSTLLKRKGIKHVVLNAKYHEMEAEFVAQAGRVGAVTIATNMAGAARTFSSAGTRSSSRAELHLRGLKPSETPSRSGTRLSSDASSRCASSAATSTTRSPASAGFTSLGPSGTSRGASTTSCAAAPAARATPARRASSSASTTTSCGSSAATD
jgi:hypothetical protein